MGNLQNLGDLERCDISPNNSMDSVTKKKEFSVEVRRGHGFLGFCATSQCSSEGKPVMLYTSTRSGQLPVLLYADGPQRLEGPQATEAFWKVTVDVVKTKWRKWPT